MPPTLSELDRRQLLADLARRDIGVVCRDAPLAAHSTWRIGGPADLLVEPASLEQIGTVVRFASEHCFPLLVIGQGSNLLFDDAGRRGIVLKFGHRFARLEIQDHRIVAEAGVWVPGLARRAQQAGLTGLEHIIGIPGTLGGLVLMNGGSHRRGIGDNVRRVWLLDRDGASRVLDRVACGFDYRHSALQESGALVVKVELECDRDAPALIRREMLADLRERRAKFPRKEPNCGSVFLSSAVMHASVGPPGKIIEEAGFKGAAIGAAEVSRRHANFIVNRGGASSRDVLALIARIRGTVRAKIGFDLRCEVRYVPPDGPVLPADRAADNLPD
jgi:UDP-N-acetylmuramate dehydrogenase